MSMKLPCGIRNEFAYAAARAPHGLAVDRHHLALDLPLKECAQRAKQASNASGSSSMKTRRKVSCAGMPN